MQLDFYKFYIMLFQSHYYHRINIIRKNKSLYTRIDVTREIFVSSGVTFFTNMILSTPSSPKTHHVTYQTSDRRYIDIAVVKSLLPSEGERNVVAWRVAPDKNPFGAWDQSPFKRYAFERLINGSIVASRQFQTCS